MPPSIVWQPAPPGRSSGFIPPPTVLEPLGAISDRPLVSVGVCVPVVGLMGLNALDPILKIVAIGVPRVSIESPRLGWLPLTKSRCDPRRILFQL
jgi:hypothetical protein